MAHAADSYVGRFYTLLFSNTAYIGGLMLLWLFNPYDIIWLDLISLVLISLGTSGAYILEDVIKDVVNHIDESEDQDKERSLARAETWLRLAHVSGSLSAILWVAVDAVGGVIPSWESSVLICIIAMTATSIIFCVGHKNYHQGELTKRPSQIFFRLIGNGIKKLSKYIIPRCCMKSPRPDKPIQNIETEKLDYVKIPKERRTTRYLDTKGKEPKAGSTSHEQADTVIVKSLLRMLPMWVMFFVVSIMSATGATFFYLQYSNLNVTHNIPIQIYSVFQGFSSFVIPVLYNKINCFSENEKTKKEKVRIGIGMLCGIFSCIFAWRLEVHRLKEVGY
ncbi:uncharacterized protein LOC143602418 [Bidens hawaiensis]|uniref:uncharacterized protein LOC143602418 n=1 Tax=Bidens hawaiensis TaxID=980011 RepID=UPI00404A1249